MYFHSTENISYVECVRHVVGSDGIMGLFGRGLKTRIMANALNSMMFSVLWKHIMEQQQKARTAAESSEN
jgi:hypothetical protein